MKVLVTGANGFLGTNTIYQLLNQGYKVKGLVRKKTNLNLISHPNLEIVVGDITVLSDIEKAIENCVFVIHIAATTDPKLLKYKEYEFINVIGTRNILKSAISNKVKKLIYVSTANVFGFGTLKNLGDETVTIKEPFDKSFYSISKLEGQNIILSNSKRIEVVVVNPSFMLGPFDSKPTSGKIILMGLKNYVLFYPPGGKSFIHVNDVSKGIVCALEKGRNGEAYLLTNENLSFKQFFEKLRTKIKRKPILIKIPKFILLTIGFFGDGLRLLGIRTTISSSNLKTLCINTFYSNNKAKNEFQLNFKTTDEAIEDTLNWIKSTRKII